MSRILDALKKAEQEKLTQAALPETVRVEAPVVSGNGHEEPVTPLNGGSTATIEGRVGTMGTSVETLLESCHQYSWNTASGRPEGANPDRDPMVSEELRTLRSRLSFIRKHQPLQKLLITSPLPREGKTFIAANLAQTLAKQHDSRVLLIDGDLRVSALHKLLDVPRAPGLSAYLLGNAELDTVMQRGVPENFYFITGGEWSENPTELLGNGRFELLMNRLAPAFDWIIIDSPPAVPVSDARLLAQFCDGVLMLVRAGVTPFDLAQKACQEFPKGQILGVVLNRASSQPGYGYYQYSEAK